LLLFEEFFNNNKDILVLATVSIDTNLIPDSNLKSFMDAAHE